MVDVFRIGKFELLAMTETKLKGDGEVSWCGVNGIVAGVQMKKAREGGGGGAVEQCVAWCSDRMGVLSLKLF